MNIPPRQHGFTLVEILVAMTVIAFALAALITSSGQSTSNASALRDRTYAHWVATNALTELRLDPEIDEPDRHSGDEMLATQRWNWQAEIITTPDPNLLRINVRVSRADEGTIVTLTGFKGRSAPQQPQGQSR